MRKRFVVALAVVTAVLGVAGLALAADSTVVVTPSASSGWVVAPDGTVPFAFAAGPASLGVGSLGFGPIDGTVGANKFVLVAPYDGATSDLTSFSYDFYVDPVSPGGAADAEHFYINVYVDDSTNGIGTFGPGPGSSGFYDCRYDLVPVVGAVGSWTTITFGQGSSWTNIADRRSGGCPSTLGGFAAGSAVIFVVLNGGQSTSSDAGLKGAFDNVLVTVGTDTTTYDFEPASACATSTSGTTITLLADCAVTSSFVVPNGFTLDGDGHSITANDPAGGHFVGGVVTAGAGAGTVRITDLEVTASGLADVCDGGADRLRGILFDGVGGGIDDVVVHGVRQGLSGCQEGNAIEVRNLVGSNPAPAQIVVTITETTVSDYQKNGVTVNGNVAATVAGNAVTGDGIVSYIAQNGIQVGFGATALVSGNAVSGNWYTAPSGLPEFDACGLLLFEASGVKQKANQYAANEKNLCNAGRGGGNFEPDA